MVEAEGRRLLYDHAKESLAATEQKLNTTRDKAKQLLASASFTLALISVSMVLLKDSRATGPGWALLLILFMFFWVVSHFLRSLRLAIRAITRDEVVLVSTQNVAKTLSTGKQDFENGRVYLQLAAEIRTAATATNVNVRQRINNVILAQTAFRWGLTLLPVLVVFYVGAILLFSTAESGRSSQESGRSRIEKAEPVELETAIKRLGDGLHKKLDHVDNRVKSIEDKVDSIKAAVERLSSAKEKSRNSPGM